MEGDLGVEVRAIDNIKGKGLFATRDIPKDSTIFEEDPLACCQFSWNASCGYQACDHCLRPLESVQENVTRLSGRPEIVVPYPECCTTDKAAIVQCSTCYVNYCSANCQAIAYNSYHRTLCVQSKENDDAHPMEILTEAWKRMQYPPETSTIMILPRILATIVQSPNPDSTLATFLQLCHRTANEEANLIHCAFGEQFSANLNFLHSLTLCLVRELWRGSEGEKCIEHLVTSCEGFRSLVAMIGTNGQGVGTSAIDQWVRGSGERVEAAAAGDGSEKEELDAFIDRLYTALEEHTGTTFLNNEGIALYALQSTINHSCAPLAECRYRHNNSRVSVVALDDIPAGAEVTISYLNPCEVARSRHSRQKELQRNYMFVCGCERCVEGEGVEEDVTSDEEEEDED